MRFEIACGADGPPKGIRLEPEEDFPVRPIFVPVLRWNRGVSPPTALAHLVFAAKTRCKSPTALATPVCCRSFLT